MDETAVRDLLERLAGDEPPPSNVSIPLARRSGRRRIRLRRVYLPSAAAPVAAAVAVALIVSLSASVQHGGRIRHHPSATAHLANAPTRFNPLVPYARFGWLPSGYSVAGLANQTTQTSTQMGSTASSRRGAQLLLTVYPADQCRISGPVTVKAPLARIRMKGLRARRRYPHSLDCNPKMPAGSLVDPGPPLSGRAPAVNGEPAYWVGRAEGGSLVWEYGGRAWAVLTYSPPVCVKCLSQHPDRHLTPLHPPSAATLAMVHQVASRVRYDVRSTVRYGFTISRLPAAWRPDRTGSAVSIPTYSVASLDGREANVGWQAGPAADPAALAISVWPAGIPGSYGCNFVAGQSSYVVLDGVRAMLRTIDFPYKHVQYLCAQDVRGMQIYLSLDLSIPTTKDTPLPDSHAVGGLLTVFKHLRLLGPDVAKWAISPRG